MSKVLVTFSAPLIFLSSDHWSQIRTAIAALSPLHDILWKPSSRPAMRTIQELDIELVGLDTIRDEHTSQIPQTLLEKPFLNIYIVTCDDNDTYKNTVKKQIKDWHTTVSTRKNQEWLILLVVRPDSRTAQGSFFALKSNVLDKIRADFNSEKKDRCVQLVWSQGVITPPACADLTSKMKDGIMSAFDAAVVQRSEEVRRSENQRQMPGWNFCTFFILKESLASSFVGMSLPDDAILTYSELEASFIQIQTSALSGQKTISWFGKLINPDPNDDSLPLLDIRKKQYRDLILNNTISVFDFRVYLLAKHCEVLGMSGRVSEMARKAATFLGGFGQRLKESEVPLPQFFVESWIYSSALNVVDECNKWAELFQLDSSSTASFSAAKGELLELARIQLDKIGISVSHLPHSPPFSMSLPVLESNGSERASPTSPASPIDASTEQLTRTDLLACLTDRDVFDKLYVDTTNRAIDMYVKGGRRKFALKLHGSLAALDLHRTRHAQAHQTYSSLPAHYTPHGWASLATFMLGRRLETHALLDKPHSREWAETVLAFLKGFVEEGFHGELAVQHLLGKGDVRQYVSKLLETVRAGMSDLDDVITMDHPMFTVEIVHGTAKHAENEDGSYVDVRVRNALPCDVVVDKIRLYLTGRDSEQLEFFTETQTFSPGHSTVTLFCPNPAVGLFVLDVSEICISTVRLQRNHQLPTRLPQHATGRQSLSLVRIPRDPKAAEIQIESPRHIQLDAPQSILLTLRSGRNFIVQGIIKLLSPTGIEFRTKNAEVTEADNNNMVECAEDCIRVIEMAQRSQVRIRIPHAYHAVSEMLKVVIQLEYHTSDGNTTITRHARFTRHVATSLPLVIQAHDHFRGKSLISKFTISTSPGTYQHLRISSVNLESVEDEQDGLVIQGCRTSNKEIVTVTPTHPANFLFRIDSEVPRIGYASMHLHIAYRLLREEIESLVERHACQAFQTHSLTPDLVPEVTRCILKALEGDGDWLERYNATQELRVQQKFLEDLINAVDGVNTYEMKAVINTVVETLRTNSSDSTGEAGWREVIVPVDLPFKNIVSAARIRIHPSSSLDSTSGLQSRHSPLYAGQPVAATLSIDSLFHWGGPGTHSQKCYAMRFDVKEMTKDWLISGRKRGDFLVTDGSTHSVPLTLIPLHHGEISLPLVNVYPLPLTSGELTMGSMALPSAEAHQIHGAEKVLVLPRGGRTTFVVGMGGE